MPLVLLDPVTRFHSYIFYIRLAFTGILVTIGRMGGAGILYGWQIPSIIVGIIKSRSLFTSKYWDLMGQKCHPNVGANNDM